MGNMFWAWAWRHERQTAKPPGDHRSLIALGGLIEYPELELVAPATGGAENLTVRLGI